jgi:hypothetical protein
LVCCLCLAAAVQLPHLFTHYFNYMSRKKTSSNLTILTLVVGSLVLYVINKSDYFLFFSLIVGLIGIFSPYLSKKMHFVWMKFSGLLGELFPRILLLVLYFCILVPISLLSRLFQKDDPLQLKNKKPSTFTSVSSSFDANFFEKIW